MLWKGVWLIRGTVRVKSNTKQKHTNRSINNYVANTYNKYVGYFVPVGPWLCIFVLFVSICAHFELFWRLQKTIVFEMCRRTLFEMVSGGACNLNSRLGCWCWNELRATSATKNIFVIAQIGMTSSRSAIGLQVCASVFRGLEFDTGVPNWQIRSPMKSLEDPNWMGLGWVWGGMGAQC